MIREMERIGPEAVTVWNDGLPSTPSRRDGRKPRKYKGSWCHSRYCNVSLLKYESGVPLEPAWPVTIFSKMYDAKNSQCKVGARHGFWDFLNCHKHANTTTFRKRFLKRSGKCCCAVCVFVTVEKAHINIRKAVPLQARGAQRVPVS